MGFISRRRDAYRQELGKEPSRVRRFVAPLYVLVGLAGLALIAFAPTPRLTPAVLGLLAFAVGLLLSGIADLAVSGSAAARAALRFAGFLCSVLGLVTFVLASALAAG